ncbi:O-antigen ligase family protein [Rhizobiaceae bacterium BDR2-2]|uniref:O-antigen ligase family protein n=1 Tax=Ectorhizobium quercum TaxID=2965071 RepID=A0AAE3MXF7_9HYPH|nr:O-antigen ligase family protein [Ectorhizobium quercum]MCX8995864.1 O-antigen ligase family protein [Ectorhizobium quercum]
MKIAFAALAILSTLPIALLLQRYVWLSRLFWTCFGALPFFLSAIPVLDIGIVSWETWAGFVYGVEITAIDFMAVIAFLILPRHRVPVFFFLPFILYIIVIALSMYQAIEPLAAFFGVWQFARMFLITAVIARASAFEEIPYLIFRGMFIGILGHFIAVLWQRFGLGLPQNTGLFVHQNTLGMALHFVLFPCLVMLLSGERSLKYLVPPLAMTLVTLILTASRASIGFAAVGIGATFLLMALAGLTRRKLAVGFAALLAVAIVGPITFVTFQKRFENAPLNEDVYDERAAFNQASFHMIHDFPFGVGLNHYVFVAKNQGYSDRAGVAPAEGNRNAIVHNAYMLAGTETGYAGFATFCLMLAVPLIVAFVSGWRNNREADGVVLLGCAMAMLVTYFHSFFEWVIFSKEIQYLLSLTMGLVFGIASRARIRETPVIVNKFTAVENTVLLNSQ